MMVRQSGLHARGSRNSSVPTGSTGWRAAGDGVVARRSAELLVAGLVFFTSLTGAAQSDLAAVSGTISDPSGAVISHATVTLTSEATGAVHRTVTNTSGFYSIPGLAPGRYTITVDAKGFQKLVTTGSNVDPSLPNTDNLRLQVGTSAQQVTVQANQATLQADSATLGRVITSNQVEHLPLNGRNPVYVALLKAGITSGPTSPVSANSSGGDSNIGTFNYSTGLGGIQINGARERDNLLTFNGAVAVRIRASGDSVGVPDLDTVQEVQVLATDYPAEYGRSIGGQIRIITKAGTEHFHGSVYEYLQNPVLNANTWVRNDNANNSNPNYPAALKTNFVAPFTFNQFGFDVNGPAIVPHVLPKGKVFFLYAEEFTHYPSLSTATATVPNPAFQTGDFSSLLTGSPATSHYLRNPQSALPCSATTGGPGCFPGNIIPASQLSPNGVALLKAFPAPTPGFQIGSSNLLQTAKYPEQQQIDTGNLDILPTEKDYIRFRLIHFSYHEDNPFSSAYDIVPRLYDRPNQTGSLDWVHTFDDRTTNEVLLTASHDAARLSIDTSNGLYNRTRYGINYPYLFPSGKDLPNKIPTVQFDTTSSITTLDGSTYPSHSQGEIFDYSDTFTKLIGDHVLRVGGLYERSGENDDDQISFSNSNPGQTNNQNGKFDFSSLNALGSGYDVADAALGIFYAYSEVGARNETPSRANLYAFFAQDSWKATPKLHLEYGLRYTLIQPYYSLWNNAGTFDPAFYNPATAVKVNPSTGNPIAGSGNALDGTVLWGNGFTSNSAGHLSFVNTGQYNDLFHNLPRGYINVQHFLIQPRLGVAYLLNSQTVLRAGFGRYVNRQGVSDYVFAGGIPPLQQVASINGGSVDNPGAGASGSYPTLSGDINRNSPQPEAYIWNVSVEREIGFGTTAEVSYVGRHALHLQYAANINQAQPGTQQAIGSLNINAYRPFLGYGPIPEVVQGDTATYQGLQVDVNRRFAHSLGFGLAYTFASSRDCTSFQKSQVPNTYDPKAVCGPSDYDMRQVLVPNAVYNIPFRSGNRVLQEALGGWELTQAYQFQAGTPFSVATTQDIAGVGAGSGPQLLQILPGAHLQGNHQFSHSGDNNSWFNVTQGGAQIFTTPPAGTFTSQRNRNIQYGPHQDYFNASLQKRFPIIAEQTLSFRLDAFDFPNHPNWNFPDTTYVDQAAYGSKTDTFGKITSKSGQRSLQASLRYSF
jgi:hypothetical protein